jgi:hypothetical protein
MARTGLRMMPTFPSSPLKFRTAGFPQYGFKAGVSAGAFPRRRPRVAPPQFASRLRAHRCKRDFLRSVSEYAVRTSTAIQAATPLYPRGPRSGPGSAARSIHTYPAPSDPLAGTARFHCSAAYTPCLRCTLPPRRPATGSVLSPLILSQHVVLCDSGESGGCIHPVPSPPTLAFIPLVQIRHSLRSHKSVPRGGTFRSFTTVRLRYNLLICSPS